MRTTLAMLAALLLLTACGGSDEDIGGSDDGAGVPSDGCYLYGAVAVESRSAGGGSRAWGIAWNHQSPAAADRRATELCARSTGDALVCATRHFGGCGSPRCGALALATGVHPLGRGDTRAEAERAAMSRCRQLTDNPCRLADSACND